MSPHSPLPSPGDPLQKQRATLDWNPLGRWPAWWIGPEVSNTHPEGMNTCHPRLGADGIWLETLLRVGVNGVRAWREVSHPLVLGITKGCRRIRSKPLISNV
jgi:hypothetical protein